MDIQLMGWSLKDKQNEAQWANLWARPMKYLALRHKNEKGKNLEITRALRIRKRVWLVINL